MSSGAVNPKTHRKWVWAYIEAIAELVDMVVSFFMLFHIYHCSAIGVRWALIVTSAIAAVIVDINIKVGAIVVFA